MANPLPESMKIGTIGELLIQLRLLQFKVQAAPPIKDSGNDLIAIKGKIFRAIQVKATTKDRFQIGKLPKRYDILALVHLDGEDNNNNIYLDKSKIFLLHEKEVTQKSYGVNVEKIRGKELSETRVNELFS